MKSYSVVGMIDAKNDSILHCQRCRGYQLQHRKLPVKSMPLLLMLYLFPLLSSLFHSSHDYFQATNDPGDVQMHRCRYTHPSTKFEVFCRVCDNMLTEGRISKVNHKRWTDLVMFSKEDHEFIDFLFGKLTSLIDTG